MKKPPFIKLYVKDFAFDIQELSNEELGAYMRSFLKAYKTGKVCKKDESESLFFELKNSIGNYEAVCRKNKNNRLKSKASNNESSTIREPVVDHSVNYEPEPLTKNQNQEPDNIYTQSFLDVWEVWPRKRRGNKSKAFSAYKSALKRDTENNINIGVRNYIDSDEAKGDYAKGFAAWFNDDRWKYDYNQTKGNGNAQKSTSIAEEFINELEEERATNSETDRAMLCSTGHVWENTRAIESFHEGDDW